LIPLVVIDSLNMLGLRMPEREEVLQLFALFRRYNTVGVCTVETGQPTPFDSTMADIVISLERTEDQGYALSYLEVEKSRFTRNVHGRHPFKTLPWEGKDVKVPAIPGKPFDVREPRCGVVVYPSIHYVKQKRQRERGRAQKGLFGLGIRGIDSHVLPGTLRRGSTLTIEGPRATFKTTFALNFLFHGLVRGESGMLIRLHDAPRLRPGPKRRVLPDLRPRVSQLVLCGGEGFNGFKWSDLKCVEKPILGRRRLREYGSSVGEEHLGSRAVEPRWGNLIGSQKAEISVWTYRAEQREGGEPQLFEIDFKSGALLPEEMIQIIEDLLIRQRGTNLARAVLDDVASIGVSYPLLRGSRTTGDLFLPVLIDFLRSSGLDLVVTGTTGGAAPSDDVVKRVCSLADSVVSCRSRDVFGERYVIVRGEGLVASVGKAQEEAGESVPGVVQLMDVRGRPSFAVRHDYLEGLVGFDGPRIYRPGLSVYVFEENDTIHKLYNDELVAMLHAGMASGAVDRGYERENAFGSADVAIDRFPSGKSEAVHDARAVLRGAPLDKTVLCTVDEFWATTEEIRDSLVESTPALYYRNVLLLAYRNDVQSELGRLRSPEKHKGQSSGVTRRPQSWRNVVQAARQIAEQLREQAKQKHRGSGTGKSDVGMRDFWFDMSATETVSCALMDALAAGCAQDSRWERIQGMGRIFEQEKLSPGQLDELESLCELFANVGPMEDCDRSVLPPNAAVYLCWYSQLRELIHRNQDLAECLNVCALPGRGFQGDWYVGIVKGSVSIALGNSILNMVTRQEEDYKRFARGVGMPAGDAFYDEGLGFFSWPRGRHVPISHLYAHIHKLARSRGKIKDYLRFRSAVWTVARQLTPLAGPPLGENDKGVPGETRREKIREIVGRLLSKRGQVAFLRRARGNRG